MKRLTVVIVGVAVLACAALLVQQGRATAYSPTNHRCPSVSTLNGFTHSYPLRIFTHDLSCKEAMGIVRTMVSGVGVSFTGNPDNASSFRWKLYGFPGWTCDCSRGSASVEWYHA